MAEVSPEIYTKYWCLFNSDKDYNDLRIRICSWIDEILSTGLSPDWGEGWQNKNIKKIE